MQVAPQTPGPLQGPKTQDNRLTSNFRVSQQRSKGGRRAQTQLTSPPGTRLCQGNTLGTHHTPVCEFVLSPLLAENPACSSLSLSLFFLSFPVPTLLPPYLAALHLPLPPRSGAALPAVRPAYPPSSWATSLIQLLAPFSCLESSTIVRAVCLALCVLSRRPTHQTVSPYGIFSLLRALTGGNNHTTWATFAPAFLRQNLPSTTFDLSAHPCCAGRNSETDDGHFPDAYPQLTERNNDDTDLRGGSLAQVPSTSDGGMAWPSSRTISHLDGLYPQHLRTKCECKV